MSEPSMKQVWAGLAMMALLTRRDYEGDFADIASDAWRMADNMEQEEQEAAEAALAALPSPDVIVPESPMN